MKRILFCLLFSLTSFFSAYAQNTWVQKLSFAYNLQGYFDTLTGVKKIEVASDGSYYVLANTEAHYVQKIFKFAPNTHQLQWSVDAGYNGSQIERWTDVIKATSDSGMVMCYNAYDNFDNMLSGSIDKYSSSGILQWSHQFIGDPFTSHTAFDIVERAAGGFYTLIEDSLYTLDAAGNTIDSTDLISGTRLIEMANGDLLVFTAGNVLTRTDLSGNIIWSQACTGVFAYDTASVFIANANSFIKKVDALSGVQNWNHDYGYSPISEIEATHDGGLIASIGYKANGVTATGGVPSPGVLFRADSSGDTLWTRTYSLPHFGLSTFKMMPGGNLLAGGCYMSGYTQAGMNRNHSAFFCMMNADGSYPLVQISYLVPGDANHDQFINFVDDALETMLSLGQTGTGRDTSVDGQGRLPCLSDFNDVAIEWDSISASGINCKYADYDGNGIIDTNDVRTDYCYSDSMPVIFRFQNQDLAQSVEEFCLVPVHDTIALGDTALFYMIMGNNANPVDSLYGFAFSYFTSYNDVSPYPLFFNSALGTIGSDLFAFHDMVSDRVHTLMCRTDFQNAINVNDTMGIVYFIGIGLDTSTVYNPVIADFKAILSNGTEIPFNVCAGTVIVDSSMVSVEEKDNYQLKVFPNPASEQLEIRKGKPGTAAEILIYDILGKKIKKIKSSEATLTISVEGLPNGFYTGTVTTENTVKNFSFVVQH